MKTLRFFLPAIAVVLLFLGSGCKNTPDVTVDPPAFTVSGSLEVGGQTYDLSTWEQGPTTLSDVDNAFTFSIVKNNVGTISIFVRGVNSGSLRGNHTLDEKDQRSGTLQIVEGPKVGEFTTGTINVTAVDDYPDALVVGDFRWVSGTFSFSGETNTGESFSGSGSFSNAQGIFL